MPPQVNARLTRVDPADVAGVDDWDVEVAPGAPPAKWAGTAAAYYREKVDRVSDGNSVAVLTRRTAWVDTADLPDVLDTDDVVTLELDDGRTVTSPARTVARSPAPAGIPSDVATTRIDLEDG